MSSTHPTGLARQVDRVLVTATLAFAAAGLGLLGVLGLELRHGPFTAASLVYGVSLLACSLCSFLYNMFDRPARRPVLRYLDHAAIFLLIAGTYTPFAAAGIHGPIAGSMLRWVWALALAGVVLKLFLREAYDRAFVPLYLALGWLGVTALSQIVQIVPPGSLLLLAAGGIAYTVGAVLFMRDIGRWTDPVWHGCVLAGKAAQFAAVVVFCLTPMV
jgi:hemolysin III